MTEQEQSKAFSCDLDALIDRYRQEFDLTYNSIVGALEFAKADVLKEALEMFDEDEDDD